MRSLAVRTLIALTWTIALPVLAAAQSSIAGTVKDTSGALLPGVTVEASSPALIEKTRSATTSSSGQYRLVELRPGIYTVTFTLPGFVVLRREAIELTADFTAQVNAELQVGALAESITVTGESPIVDTQNITQRTVMTREVLDVIPSGRNIQAVGIMIPGTNLSFGGGAALSRDVGGSGGLQQSPLIFRGSPDAVQTVEGMRLNNLCANGAYSGVYWNDGSFQELSYVTGADSAEMAQGGIRINMVPKDGGNTFRGMVVGNYTPSGTWQAANLRDNLSGDLTSNPNNRITNVSVIKKIWDFNPSFGGPIFKDRVWFHATFRHWGVEKTVADSFFDADPAPFRYAADRERPGVDDGHIVSRVGRVTWQVSGKDKISYYHDDQSKYRNHWGISALISPEASAVQVTPTSFVSVAKWNRAQSTRLYFDVGFAMYNQEYTELYQPEVTDLEDKIWDDAAIAASRVYSITEQTNSRVFSAWNAPADHFSILRQYSAAVSYVTGAHVWKFGGTLGEGPRRTLERYTGDLTMTFSNALPQSVTLRTPLDQREGIKADIGLYVQDKWTFKRATVNAGLRLDWFRGEVLDEDLPAGRWSPAAHFDGFQVQNWKDINPRLGVSYDLFGNGKTAVKASVARYVNGEMVATAAANNPQTTIGRTDVRTWTDNGDFTIFNSDGSLQAGELGPSTNSNFGRLIASSTSTDPEVLNGWHVRPYNWEYAVSVQHELLPRVGISGSYGRRSFFNQTAIDNQLTDANSYDGPFCITAPNNPNLPGGGGYPVCGLYDIKPTFQGQVRNIRRLASHYGGITDISSGFEFTVNARPWSGTFIQGGIAASKRNYNTCNAPLVAATPGITALAFAVATSQVDNPEGQWCDQTFPYRPDVKLLGSHNLPWDISLSGTYQFSRGVQNPNQPSIVADWQAPNAVIAAGLGRNLAAGATATKIVRLIQPGTEYGDQDLHQLDLRASKRFRFSRYSFRIDADLYNAFNSNWPYTVNTTFATTATSSWLRPTNVLQGRFFKLGGQFSF